MTEAMHVFNRDLVRRRRDRAATALAEHAFLFEETAERLLDRLDDVKRSFPLALDLGCHAGELAAAQAGRGGIETLVQADLSPAMAARAHAASGQPAVVCDEEFLPCGKASLDLVLSNLSLHWVNDLPGALLQIRHALKPDGLFLASLLGGATLKELRHALAEAEIEIDGGLSPRVSPFAEVRDLGSLLQRAGFALPVVDIETITVSYSEPLKLLRDLRGMGETNAVAERRRTPLKRAVLLRALEIYRDEFAEADGRLPATFEVLTVTGWAPAASQPQPLQPGSARSSLADALDTEEVPLGEKAMPRKR